MIQESPLEIVDFSGGKTDYFVSGDTNKAKELDNFVLLKYGNTAKLLERPGSYFYNDTGDTYKRVDSTGRISELLVLNNELLPVIANKIYYMGTGWTEKQGPNSTSAFYHSTKPATVSNYVSSAIWGNTLYVTNDQSISYDILPIKIYKDGSNNLQLRTAGLPRMESTPTYTDSGSGIDYVYKFTYEYTYTVGTITHVDESPAVTMTTNSGVIGAGDTVVISGIPSLAGHHYDTAKVKKNIYRTKYNGTTFYLVTQISNATPGYSDNTTDANLGREMYITGGVVENDPPPRCKYLHNCNGIMYYGYYLEGTEIKSNFVRQSIPNDPDSCPEDFYVELQDNLSGISSVKGIPIFLCNSLVYRCEGNFDELGRGYMNAIKISDTAGCISHQSIVQTIDGIYWAGRDGFYYSNGFDVIKISKELDETYKILTSIAAARPQIQGKYDGLGKRIYWTVRNETGSSDCDTLFCLDLRFGIKENMPFTTWSGAGYFHPTAIAFIDITSSGKITNYMIRATKNGYIYKHHENYLDEYKEDTSVSPSNWYKTAIIFNYISCAYNMGTSFLRKFSPKILVSCANRTNLSLQIISINDQSSAQYALKPIRFRDNILWGDEDVIWGDPDIIWGFDKIIEEQRFFPAGTLRYAYKQVRMTNAKVVISKDDNLGLVTINALSKTVTLEDAATRDWPKNSVDYYISFEEDNYTKEYLITSRSDDTLVYSDSGNTSISGAGKKWTLRGIPKNERFELISYIIHFALIGKTQKVYTTASAGEH